MARWETGPGVVEFPSGRRIRCRSWSEALAPSADLTILLTSADLSGDSALSLAIEDESETVTIDWADGRLPRRPGQAQEVLRDALVRCTDELVELVGGGASRIGASLAIMGIHDGMPADESLAWVASAYSDGAVDSHAHRAFIMEVGEDEHHELSGTERSAS